jgi:hypothetical protein
VQIFIAALFITARTWKQPECLAASEWLKKLGHPTMVYYSVLKGNVVLSREKTRGTTVHLTE